MWSSRVQMHNLVGRCEGYKGNSQKYDQITVSCNIFTKITTDPFMGYVCQKTLGEATFHSVILLYRPLLIYRPNSSRDHT